MLSACMFTVPIALNLDRRRRVISTAASEFIQVLARLLYLIYSVIAYLNA